MDSDDLEALRAAWTAERVTELRTRLGLTQGRLAPHLGFSHYSRVSELEREGGPLPSAPVALILEYLDRFGPLDHPGPAES